MSSVYINIKGSFEREDKALKARELFEKSANRDIKAIDASLLAYLFGQGLANEIVDGGVTLSLESKNSGFYEIDLDCPKSAYKYIKRFGLSKIAKQFGFSSAFIEVGDSGTDWSAAYAYRGGRAKKIYDSNRNKEIDDLYGSLDDWNRNNKENQLDDSEFELIEELQLIKKYRSKLTPYSFDENYYDHKRVESIYKKLSSLQSISTISTSLKEAIASEVITRIKNNVLWVVTGKYEWNYIGEKEEFREHTTNKLLCDFYPTDKVLMIVMVYGDVIPINRDGKDGTFNLEYLGGLVKGSDSFYISNLDLDKLSEVHSNGIIRFGNYKKNNVRSIMSYILRKRIKSNKALVNSNK